MSRADMQMFRIAINNRIALCQSARLGGQGSIPGRDMSVSGPLVLGWS
jgi:hypothetical protein